MSNKGELSNEVRINPEIMRFMEGAREDERATVISELRPWLRHMHGCRWYEQGTGGPKCECGLSAKLGESGSVHE